MLPTLTAPQALIYAMISISAVDREISDQELSRIGSIVRELPAFSEYDDEWLIGEAQACAKVVSGKDGLQTVLTLIKESLPSHLFETAYVLAAEVAAADLTIKSEEIRFLQLLGGKLEIDQLTCAALERGARARHQQL